MGALNMGKASRSSAVSSASLASPLSNSFWPLSCCAGGWGGGVVSDGLSIFLTRKLAVRTRCKERSGASWAGPGSMGGTSDSEFKLSAELEEEMPLVEQVLLLLVLLGIRSEQRLAELIISIAVYWLLLTLCRQK